MTPDEILQLPSVCIALRRVRGMHSEYCPLVLKWFPWCAREVTNNGQPGRARKNVATWTDSELQSYGLSKNDYAALPKTMVARYREAHIPWKRLCAGSSAETKQRRTAAMLKTKRELVTRLEELKLIRGIRGEEDAAPAKNQGISKKRLATAEEKDEDEEDELDMFTASLVVSRAATDIVLELLRRGLQFPAFVLPDCRQNLMFLAAARIPALGGAHRQARYQGDRRANERTNKQSSQRASKPSSHFQLEHHTLDIVSTRPGVGLHSVWPRSALQPILSTIAVARLCFSRP